MNADRATTEELRMLDLRVLDLAADAGIAGETMVAALLSQVRDALGGRIAELDRNATG